MSIETTNDLTGKTALITGASSGLGARFASVLAAAGANVIIAARRTDRLAELQETINASGGTAHAKALDVNQLDKISGFFDSLAADGLLPDILVNNAGLNIVKPATDYTPDDYNTVMGTNLTAPFFLSSELAKRHIGEGVEGRIINIASVGGYQVLPGNTPYCVSKSGIIMMTRGLAREWARYGINVNAICPGYIETEINDFWWQTEQGQKQIHSFPRRRLADKSDLDGTLLLLAGPLGRGMTGTTITVDDGQYI
jgi:NAD(P)-dependent dehydrogenase (short-subunit alcohol dehydrogenase family)